MPSNIFYTVEISAWLDTSLDLEYKFQFCNALGLQIWRKGKRFIFENKK